MKLLHSRINEYKRIEKQDKINKDLLDIRLDEEIEQLLDINALEYFCTDTLMLKTTYKIRIKSAVMFVIVSLSSAEYTDNDESVTFSHYMYESNIDTFMQYLTIHRASF